MATTGSLDTVSLVTGSLDTESLNMKSLDTGSVNSGNSYMLNYIVPVDNLAISTLGHIIMPNDNN